MNSPTNKRSKAILSTSQLPICGIRKITNAVITIFRNSGPEASPKSRLAVPVRTKRKDRIPMTTPEMLFRKIPIHWISVKAHTTGRRMIFTIHRISFILLPAPFRRPPPVSSICSRDYSSRHIPDVLPIWRRHRDPSWPVLEVLPDNPAVCERLWP